MKLPFGTILITEKAKKLVNEVLDKKRVSSGVLVREFEKRFAKIIGVKEAVAVSSGTDADALALAVLYDFGAKRGDEIIIPALSFVGTGNAVLQAGFIPVFVDIDIDTLNIIPGKIEKCITKKTRAIMPVHLMGKPAEMDTINKIAKKYKLYVIEDAAEAHGTIYKGRKVGSLADMACYSLYVAHMITTVEGGIITTNNGDFSEIIRSLRSHGRACKCESCVLNTASAYCARRFHYKEGYDIRFIFERIGFSSKMNELEAAIGLGSMDCYKEIFDTRRKNFLSIKNKFKKFEPDLFTIKEESYEIIGPQAFPVIVGKRAKFNRDQLINYLNKNGIDTRDLFLSMPTQCPGFKFLGYKYGEFPNAEYIGKSGFHIGCHQDISGEQIDYFINSVENFLKKI